MKKFTLLASMAAVCALGAYAADGDCRINYLDGPTSSGVCPLVIEYDDNSAYWLSTAGYC